MEFKTMRIPTIILSLILCAQLSSTAQTWNEWFKQKKTQRKYHYQQIAALQAHLEFLKKGITIAYKGLTTVYNIKNGDFNLHRDFFGSLSKVNPHISNSAKVADIIAFQIYIIRNLKEVHNFCRSNRNFTPEEVRYVGEVYASMLYLSDVSISELVSIIRTDKSEMQDDARIRRIDQLYDDTLDKHAFVKSFGNEVRILERQREKERRESEILRKLNGIT
jgi:hypothetical protein